MNTSGLDARLRHARGARPDGPAPVDIISVQSQLVYGHAGNSAALEPLLALGLRVAAVPTTLLSNAPVYATTRGRVLPADWFADLLHGADERGLPARATMLLSGYLGSVGNGAALADWVERVLPRCPRLRYCLDAVIGDTHTGAYVEPGLAAIMRQRLLPRAWMVMGNVFELEQLAGRACHDTAACLTAAHELLRFGPRWMVVHGIREDAHTLVSLVVSTDASYRLVSPYLPIDVTGTGDVLAALLTGLVTRGVAMHTALERATAGVHAALEATMVAQVEELAVHHAAPAALDDGPPRFAALPVD
jgi:pyridoxine kinase